MNINIMQNKILHISIIETIYIIFMFHFFKTRTDFNIIPKLSIIKEYSFLNHLSGNEYGLRICLFGRIVIWGFILVLLLRNFYILPKYSQHCIIVLSMILSLLNMNAIVYLTPIWIIEILIMQNIIHN